METSSYSILLSLNSFIERNVNGVQLLGVDRPGFVVMTTPNVYAFSYILVNVTGAYYVGTATLYYPIIHIVPSTSMLIHTNTTISSPNALLS